MQDNTQKYTQFYRNAYEAFRAGDMEAFERLGGLQRGMFDTFEAPFGYKYTPQDAVYLTSVEYRIE